MSDEQGIITTASGAIESVKTALDLVRVSEPQARGFLKRAAALELGVLPLQIVFKKEQKILQLAAAAIDDFELRQKLTFATGLTIQLLQVPAELLKESISQAYLGDEEILLESANRLHAYGRTIVPPPVIDSLPSSNEVTTFVDNIIEYAIAHQASDIHLAARAEGLFIQLRIGGYLRNHAEAISNIEAQRQVVSRIKILAALDITERSRPQDGRIRYKVDQKDVDIRVSTVPTVHGENVVLRLFGLRGVPRLSELDFSEALHREIGRIVQRCSGCVVIAGPTGSGKSSSLYAIAQELNLRGKSVSTIEDPVEVLIDGIAQTSINVSAGLNFAQALRSVLRQDPDVILVGEMRDKDSAEIAFDAALSGHLILSMVHGGSVVDALNRFQHLGVSRIMAAQSLELIIAQRLVNRLCIECRVFDLRAANSVGFDVFRPVGCARCCHSGYQGKVLLTEALSLDDQFREFLSAAEIITREQIAKAARGRFWEFKEQVMKSLEKGEIGYGQYLELV